MEFPDARSKIDAFVKKTYELVDDPSTDKIISWAPNGITFVVWKPLKCARDLLPQHLGITDFSIFHSYGFSKIYSGEQVEFICKDFEKGHPELLDKISDRYVAKLTALYEKRYKPYADRLKNAKTKEEWDLVVKERKEERMASSLKTQCSLPAQVQPSLI